jgi:isoprenylcysteine carboxyl methyltransferase (ICMT) family protein YpbQ
MNNYEKKDLCGIAFFITSIIFLIFVSYMAFTKPFLWTDEIFTLSIVKLPIKDLISLTSIDMHPPLYYLIFKFFLKIGNFINFTDIIMIGRFVSLLPVYLLVIVSILKLRKNFGLLAAGLFTLTLISMPQMMNFAVELRMYGWGLFFVTCSFILIYDLIKNDFNYFKWIILTILTIAGFYTHYYVAVALSLIYLFILYYLIRNDREKLKIWMISVAVIVISYLPWIPIIFQQISKKMEIYWIEPITVHRFLEYFAYIFSPDSPFLYGNEPVTFSIFGLLLLIVAVVLLVKNNRDFDSKYAILGIATCLIVPVIGVIISAIFRPFFHPRYIIPVLGVFWLGFSILLSKNFDKRVIFIPFVIVILSCSVVGSMTFYDNLNHRQEVDTNITDSLQQTIGNDNIIICCQNSIQRHFSNYFLPDNIYFVDGYWSNETYNDFIVYLNGILNDPGVQYQIQSGKKVYIVNLLKGNNTIPLEHENFYLVEKPLNVINSSMFNDYTNLRIYEVNFRN